MSGKSCPAGNKGFVNEYTLPAQTLFQVRKFLSREQEPYAARLVWLLRNETFFFELHDHAVDGWRRDSEIPLHIRFRRRTAIEFRVVVYESEILSLLGRILFPWARGFWGWDFREIYA